MDVFNNFWSADVEFDGSGLSYKRNFTTVIYDSSNIGTAKVGQTNILGYGINYDCKSIDNLSQRWKCHKNFFFLTNIIKLFSSSWGLYHKTFYGRNYAFS
jgi:hypothetical protein